jgi:hypothetical protein
MAFSGILESFVTLTIISSSALMSTSLYEKVQLQEQRTKALIDARSSLSESVVEFNTWDALRLNDFCQAASSSSTPSQQLLADAGLSTWIREGNIEKKTEISSCTSAFEGQLNIVKLKISVRLSGSETLLAQAEQELRKLQ